MPNPPVPGPEDSERLLDTLRDLEHRISRLEEHLGLPSEPAEASRGLESRPSTASRAAPVLAPSVSETPAQPNKGAGPSLEQRLGEFGFAWLGSALGLLGLMFGVAWAFGSGWHVAAALLGYGASVGLYVGSRALEKGFEAISRLLIYDSGLLLYFTTVRLHFFTDQPLLGSEALAVTVLLLVLAFLLYQALRRSAPLIAWIALTLGLLTALFADSAAPTLILVGIGSAAAIYVWWTRGWWPVLLAHVPLTWITLLLWLVGNPLMGHALSTGGASAAALACVLFSAGAFSWPTFFYDEEASRDLRSVSLILFNVLGATALVGLLALWRYADGYTIVFTSLALIMLGSSTVQWRRTRQQMAPGLYANFGFLSLTVAILGFAGLPQAFFWLALQSLLVVSMALWFRSRFLVVANSLIFALLLLIYLVLSQPASLVDFSFAVVALLSARIMNWQKERLTLRTELLRNAYLFFAFVFVGYTLLGIVPHRFVALAWAGAAAGYFLLSVALSNVKYRWLGLGTLLAAIIYALFVNLAGQSPALRIVAFLGLGALAVVVSLFYSRLRRFLTHV